MSSAALILLLALGQAPRKSLHLIHAVLVQKLGAPRSPTARRPPPSSSAGPVGAARPAGGRQSRDMEIKTRARACPENRNGAVDPANFRPARFRWGVALGSGEFAQPADRFQDRALSAKPPAVEDSNVTLRHHGSSHLLEGR